jgi:hypothetical protein
MYYAYVSQGKRKAAKVIRLDLKKNKNGEDSQTENNEDLPCFKISRYEHKLIHQHI